MTDRTISALLEEAGYPLLSYEFFPPKDDRGLDRLRAAAERLLQTEPDFVTCTWGAGGSTRQRTLEVCELLREMGFGPVMPHLTCVGVSRSELEETADEIYERGFRNVMTLRGDPPRGETTFKAHEHGLSHAWELVRLLKERHPDLCCGVAGYPEKHPEAATLEEDIRHLREKVEAGADFITTQLFFSNEVYKRFLEQCRAAGIEAPIIPGLLPAMSLKQVARFTKLCGSTFPEELARRMEQAGGEGPEAEQVGIAWAAEQIEGLVAHGAPAVHLYVLNRSKAAMGAAVKAAFDRARRRAT